MAPTLTAVAQSTATGGVAVARTLLTLTWPGIQQALVKRLDPDGVLRTVRAKNGDDYQVCIGSCAFFDHETPLDQAVTYQATSPQNSGGATDAFARTVSNGWGTADTGQAWTNTNGSASDFSVGSGVGQHSSNSTNVQRFTTLDTNGTDIKISVDTTAVIGSAATANVQQWVVGRMLNTSNFYAAKIDITTTGDVQLRITKVVAGVTTDLAGPTTIDTGHASVDTYRVTLQIQGTTLSAKAWFTGNAEPAAFQLTTTDTALTTGTLAGVMSIRVTGNTNTSPVITQFDNLAITGLTALTVTSSSVTVSSGGLAWLSHPGHPQYAAATDVTDVDVTYAGRYGQFWPIGAALPVTVTDLRAGGQGTVIWQVDTLAQYQRIRNLIADGGTLLMRLPSTWSGDTWYITPGDIKEVRANAPIATDTWRRYEMPFVRVDRPAGASDGAVGQTYNDLKAAGYANYNALNATGKTYTQLAQSVT